MTFHHPSIWWLLALVVVPLLWWRWSGRRFRAEVAYSSIRPVAAVGATWAVPARWLIPILRTIAIIVLIIAVARPQEVNEETQIFTEGIAIQLIVDRSGSMEALDFELNGRTVSRLEAVKRVVEDFVTGGEDLPGRPADLIGLITFASFADGISPLTLDHGHLVTTIRDIGPATQGDGTGTAIGDAIALGVERMHSLSERSGNIKSKVIILLTDGENNQGDLLPATAAEMAAAFDIRIYTIGAGTDGLAPLPWTDPFGRRTVRQVPLSIDEETLREVASITDGRYFRATGTNSLKEVYEQIDELERTEMEVRHFVDRREAAVQSTSLAGLPVPPLLALVVVLLSLEMVLSHTRLRTLP